MMKCENTWSCFKRNIVCFFHPSSHPSDVSKIIPPKFFSKIQSFDFEHSSRHKDVQCTFKNREAKQSIEIKAIANDMYQFFCLPCNKSVSFEHQGISDPKNRCIPFFVIKTFLTLVDISISFVTDMRNALFLHKISNIKD